MSKHFLRTTCHNNRREGFGPGPDSSLSDPEVSDIDLNSEWDLFRLWPQKKKDLLTWMMWQQEVHLQGKAWPQTSEESQVAPPPRCHTAVSQVDGHYCSTNTYKHINKHSDSIVICVIFSYITQVHVTELIHFHLVTYHSSYGKKQSDLLGPARTVGGSSWACTCLRITDRIQDHWSIEWLIWSQNFTLHFHVLSISVVNFRPKISLVLKRVRSMKRTCSMCAQL